MGGHARGAAKPRLTPGDWTRAALDALVEDGPEGLRIARIARRLGVTPGSFYWHFRDRNHLRAEILRCWQQLIERAGSAAEAAGGGSERLRALPTLLAERKLPDLDGATRTWAQTDPVVAAGVARADRLRVRRVAAMLRAAGLDEATAERRAPLLLWAHIGSLGSGPARRGLALQELAQVLLSPSAS